MQWIDVAIFFRNTQNILILFALFALKKVLTKNQPKLIYFIYFVVFLLHYPLASLLQFLRAISVVQAQPSFLLILIILSLTFFFSLLRFFSFFITLFMFLPHFYLLNHIYKALCHLFIVFFRFHNQIGQLYDWFDNCLPHKEKSKDN